MEVTRWGEVEHRAGAATFVERTQSTTSAFEPIDESTLLGLATEVERADTRTRLELWLVAEFVPWLTEMLSIPELPARRLVELQVVWQLVVHLGGGERLAYHLDFRLDAPAVVAGEHPTPNYAVHVSGRALRTVLRGEGGSELFWLAGASRYYEKILFIDGDGRIAAPPERGWDLFEAVPEPFSWCLRKHGPGSVANSP